MPRLMKSPDPARIKRTVSIPFQGFYGTKWADIIDNWENQQAEWYVENQAEEGILEELHLDQDFFHNSFIDCMSYGLAYYHIAKDYAQALSLKLKADLGLDLGLRFEAMDSPREYNFETDRVFCHIPRTGIKALWRYSLAKDNHATLEKLTAERFTSRSGFISSYANSFRQWPSDVMDWDHNQLGTLLRVAVADLGEDYDWDIYYGFAENDYHYADKAMDYDRFNKLVADAREDKRQELADEAEERGETLELSEPRCPDTLDLFKSTGA